MEKSLKEVVKELYGVDTLTPEEFRAEVDSRGWTKEMTVPILNRLMILKNI